MFALCPSIWRQGQATIDAVAGPPGLKRRGTGSGLGEIVGGDQFLENLADTGSGIACRDQMDSLLQAGKGVGDGHRKSAETQERMIVLRIADSDHCRQRHVELGERRGQPCALVHSGRQDHHRFPVEDDLQVESQFAYDLLNRGFMRSHRGNDSPADGDRVDAELVQPFREAGGGKLAQGALLRGGRTVQQSAIFRDHQIEPVQLREHFAYAPQFAAGDEDELPARFSQTCQGRQCVALDTAVISKGAVEIRRHDLESQFSPPLLIDAGTRLKVAVSTTP